MSMGNIESYHQVVKEETMKKVVGKRLLDSFTSQLKELADEYSDDEVNDALNEEDFWGDIDPDSAEWKKLEKAYGNLKDAFTKATGMCISYTFLDGDGDCYDDLESGCWYWELDEDDVWIPKKLSKKAKEFQEKYGAIETDQRFSTYG